MISFNWVITLPKHLTADEFDAWYLGIHTEVAKVAHKIVRYSINRRVDVQPEVAPRRFFRIAQEYWEDWDAWWSAGTTPTGCALLGDGMVNMGLSRARLPGIALTEHTQFDVAEPARSAPSSAATARGPTARSPSSSPSAWPRTRPASRTGTPRRFADLGKNPLVREHVFGTTVGKTIQLGMVGTLPTEGQLSYDWNLELWFDSNADAIAYLDSAPFKDMFAELRDVSTDTLAGLFRGQEMLMLNTALPHRDE